MTGRDLANRQGAIDVARAALASDLRGSVPSEVEIMPAGRVETRPNDSRDPFHNRDPEAVVAATRELQLDLPVDYDHQSEYARENGQPAIAAGWIRDLFVRDGAVWGRAEWTDRAKAHIEAREYRFLSPVFTYGRAEREVRMIESVALTNNPAFFMRALASSERDGTTDSEGKNMKKDELIKLLGLESSATDEEVGNAVKALATAAKAAVDGLKAIASALGLDDKATADDIAEAAKTARAAASAAGTTDKGDAKAKAIATVDGAIAAGKFGLTQRDSLLAMASSNPEALATLVENATGTAESKAIATVDAAVKAGKLTPAERDGAIAMATASPKEFESMLARAGVVITDGKIVPDGRPKGGDGTLSAEERAVCRAMGISEEDYQKSAKELKEQEA